MVSTGLLALPMVVTKSVSVVAVDVVSVVDVQSPPTPKSLLSLASPVTLKAVVPVSVIFTCVLKFLFITFQ